MKTINKFKTMEAVQEQVLFCLFRLVILITLIASIA